MKIKRVAIIGGGTAGWLSAYDIQVSQTQLHAVKQMSEKLCAELPNHREWLTKCFASGKSYLSISIF